MGKTEQQVQTLEDELLSKLDWWELKNKLAKQWEITLAGDIGIYKQQLLTLQDERKTIMAAIDSLKQELNASKLQQNNQEQYNITGMMQQINKEPPRKQTMRKLKEMQDKLQNIDVLLKKCTKKMQRRKKQCYAAFAAVQALHRDMSGNDDDNDSDVDMQ